MEVEGAPSPDWLGAYHYRGGPLPERARELLVRHDRVGFALVRGPDRRVLAIARGAVDDGWLGVTAVEVDPSARRTGLATAILLGLADWAQQHGATRCYLQVSADNAPALALYHRLGFYRHHSYRYRALA